MITDQPAARGRIRDIVLFISVAGVHLIVSVALFVFVFGRGMARFDSGAPRGAAATVNSVAGVAVS